MTAGERPWWATDEDAVDGPTDPLEAHRAARRGTRPSDHAEAADPGATDPGATDPGATDPGAADPGVSDRGSGRPGDGVPPPDDGSWWVPATEAAARLVRDLSAAAFASSDRGPGRDGQQGGGHADPADRADRAEHAHHADHADRAGPHRVDACGVCPICVGLRVLGDVRPDLVEHLSEAARQLTLAVHAVVAAAASPEQAPSASGRDHDDGLRRIDLDD